MELPNLNLDEIREFLETYGKRGADVVSFLGKYTKHFDAVYNTEPGQEILKYDMNNMKLLAEKIYREIATADELAEFRYLKKRMAFESDILKKYMDALNKVKRVTNDRTYYKIS